MKYTIYGLLGLLVLGLSGCPISQERKVYEKIESKTYELVSMGKRKLTGFSGYFDVFICFGAGAVSGTQETIFGYYKKDSEGNITYSEIYNNPNTVIFREDEKENPYLEIKWIYTSSYKEDPLKDYYHDTTIIRIFHIPPGTIERSIQLNIRDCANEADNG